MRWLLVLAVVAACAAGASAQLSRYTVVAKTMSEAKIVPTEPPVTADRDELMGGPIADAQAQELPAVKPKPTVAAVKAGKKVAAKGKGKGKANAKAAAAKEKKADAKTAVAKTDSKAKAKAKDAKAKAKAAVKKPQPGAASKAAVAAIPKAPKDQLMKWIRSRAPADTTEAAFKKLELYLMGESLYTFEDLLARGEEGVKALVVGDKWRAEFMELLLKRIAQQNGVSEAMVPTPALVKGGIKKKTCHRHGEPRFRSVSVPKSGLVGDWLKAVFPETKPLRMARTVLALERQAIRTFADLRGVGVKGIKRLLYVPKGVREALYEAVLDHIGAEGHDDGKFVPATRYVPPPPTKADGDCN